MKILNLLTFSVLAYMSVVMVSCDGTESGNGSTEGSPAYNLGYAYGVQMGQALKGAKELTDDEKNVDKFVEGLKEAFKGDSAALVLARNTLNQRQKTGASATPEAGGQIAYCIGVTSNIGMVAQEVKIPMEDFDFVGVKDGYIEGLKSDSFKLTKVEIDSILQAYLKPKFDEYTEIMKAKDEAKMAVAIEEGKKFLEANKEKEGIIVTESGLQYEVIEPGNGPKPTLEDKVKTHYHGTLINGNVFDSSVERGEPSTFPVNGVIQGWQEGIPLMSVGAKYKFYIPQELAYGTRAMGPKIPGGSTLIFEVELLEINPEPAPAPPTN